MAGSCYCAAAGNRSAVAAVGSSFSIRSLVRCLQRIVVAAVVAPPAMVDVVVLSF